MDTNRYADLVNMYANNVYKIAVSYCNNRSDAEDIVQETFLKLWQIREKLDGYNSVEALAVQVAKMAYKGGN